VLFFQLKFDKFEPHHKDEVIGMWIYSKEYWLTNGIELLLNINFRFNENFNKMSERLTSLPILAIAKKRL